MEPWGAGYVLGVGSSTGIVDDAKGLLRREGNYTGKLNFRVGNALDLGKIDDEGPFHVVVGVWLLNYASNLGEMTSMYRTISASLEDGGVFIAITPRRWRTWVILPSHGPISQLGI